MAGQAVDAKVPPIQKESGRSVVECHRSPAVLVVARDTAAVRGILIGMAQVGILMAGDTGIVGRNEVDGRIST